MKDQSHGKVISVETASWDTLGIRDTNEFANWHRKETLSQLYTSYRVNTNLLARISDVFTWQEQGRLAFPADRLEYLNSKKEELDSQQSVIASKAGACIERNACDSSGLPRIAVELPQIPDVQGQSIQRFGRIFYRLPEFVSYYGSQSSYDGKNVQYYDIPVLEIGDVGLSTARIMIFEQECDGAKTWIEGERANLVSRGIALPDVKKLSETTTVAYELEWRESRLSKLIAFEKGSNSKCAVVKADAGGDNLSSWQQLNRFSRIVDSIAMFLSYR
jgi:hypothetical protein